MKQTQTFSHQTHFTKLIKFDTLWTEHQKNQKGKILMKPKSYLNKLVKTKDNIVFESGPESLLLIWNKNKSWKCNTWSNNHLNKVNSTFVVFYGKISVKCVVWKKEIGRKFCSFSITGSFCLTQLWTTKKKHQEWNNVPITFKFCWDNHNFFFTN